MSTRVPRRATIPGSAAWAMLPPSARARGGIAGAWPSRPVKPLLSHLPHGAVEQVSRLVTRRTASHVRHAPRADTARIAPVISAPSPPVVQGGLGPQVPGTVAAFLPTQSKAVQIAVSVGATQALPPVWHGRVTGAEVNHAS